MTPSNAVSGTSIRSVVNHQSIKLEAATKAESLNALEPNRRDYRVLRGSRYRSRVLSGRRPLPSGSDSPPPLSTISPPRPPPRRRQKRPPTVLEGGGDGPDRVAADEARLGHGGVVLHETLPERLVCLLHLTPAKAQTLAGTNYSQDTAAAPVHVPTNQLSYR